MKIFLKSIVAGLLTLSVLLTFAGATDNYGSYFDNSVEAVQQKEYKQKFWDVSKNHWAFDAIAELSDRGAINGYPDGSFKPENTVTRAEWAKIMIQAAGLTVNDYSVRFADMKGHWAAPYVNAASSYLSVFSDNRYRPDQAVTREDVTMAMVKLKGYNLNEVDYSVLSMFKDVASISNSMKVYVAVAVEKGLINGFNDGTFRGQATLTRAQAATLLLRAFQYGNDNKTTPDATPAPQPEETKQPETQPSVTPEVPEKTEKPQPSSTTEQTPEPTPESTPEIIKPYQIDTLIPRASDIQSMVFDGSGTLYYVSDGTLYCEDGTELNLDLFYATLAYDTKSDILYLTGIQKDYSAALYNVTDMLNPSLIMDENSIENSLDMDLFSDSWMNYPSRYNSATVLSNGTILVGTNRPYILHPKNKTCTLLNVTLVLNGSTYQDCYAMGNKLYISEQLNDSIMIESDFGLTKGKEIRIEGSGFPSGSKAVCNDAFICYWKNGEGILGLDSNGITTRLIDVNMIEVLDLQSMQLNVWSIAAFGKDKFALYDNSLNAIRVIEKNN